MIHTEAFRALINLVEFDQSMLKVATHIETIKHHINDAQMQQQGLAKQSDQAKQRLLEWRKLVDEKELLMKTLDDQERTKKEQLDRVHNNKEYVAIQSEINALKLEQHNLEADILDVWNKRDAAHAEYDVIRQQSHEATAQLQTQITQEQVKLSDLEKQYAQLQSERVNKASIVPTEWIEKYNALGSRIQNPVIAIEGDACGGCFSPLTTHELMRLRRGALLQCQSCFRFLYAPDVMEGA